MFQIPINTPNDVIWILRGLRDTIFKSNHHMGIDVAKLINQLIYDIKELSKQ